MKKLLIIMVTAATLLFSQNASAQIAIGDRGVKLKEVAVLMPAAAWLFVDYTHWEPRYRIAMKSTNQFDDWFWLNLGNREQALVCLDALLNLVNTLDQDEEVTVTSMGDDEPFLVSLRVAPRRLWFSQRYKAGSAALSKNAIKSAIAWFDTNFM